MSTPHTFVDLFSSPTDLEDWIAVFCARRQPSPPIGPPFPALVAGQSTADWLVDQFDLLATQPGMRDKFRDVVVMLIATHGGREPSPEASDQIVGTLLDVAGKLRFMEISRHLADWVRKPWLQEKHVYRVGNTQFTLRRKVWSILIGWGCVDGIMPQLTHGLIDLAMSGEAGTAQMCFVALGEREPADALPLLPKLLTMWHLVYWTAVVQRFIRSVGAEALLNLRYERAWAAFVGPCLYDDTVYRHLRAPRPFREADTHRENYLYKVLAQAGVTLEDDAFSDDVLLRSGSSSLRVDMSANLVPWAVASALPKISRRVSMAA